MPSDIQPNRVDPDGETQAYLPEEPGPFSITRPVQVDPFSATRATVPEPPPSFYNPAGFPYNDQPGETQAYPVAEDPLARYQPIPVRVAQKRQPAPRRPRRRGGLGMGCGCVGLLFLLLIAAAYFLVPLPTNLLALGLDRAPDGTALSRTDTMMLISVNPLLPDVKILSIPRDLWISIPGVGENRINTVHFFAESQRAGSGPATTLQVVRDTFHVPVSYYVRVRFDGVVGIVDAMGGVDVNMPSAMSGYDAGLHHLTGAQALAFARDRKGADDFFRMAHGQLLVKSVVRGMLSPGAWFRLPQITAAVFQMVDTNLPFWQWPRLGVAMVRAVLGGAIDSRTFDRQMATPFVTSGGAQVLMPQWNLINPLVHQMFGG